MKRDGVIETLSRTCGIGVRGAVGASAVPRGDHDLNPGMTPRANLKAAAVLVPLVDYDDGFRVLLTLRTAHLAYHAGQISFPGGHMEATDGTPENTALRETEEEIGLPRDYIQIIGRLDNYITGTGFDVTPIVGLVEPGFTLRPDPSEVAEAFEVPLSFFLDPTNHQRHWRMINGRRRDFYAMPYESYYIWGATAGILVNLYERLIDS